MDPGMETRFAALEERLGVTFKNRILLIEAVTHRSYLNENRDRDRHNERLEFLGDAVLELIVTEHLFRRFPNAKEGQMTEWRSALVCADNLGPVAKQMGLAELMLMAKGERHSHLYDSGSKAFHYIMANAFEAVLGAIYMDQGIGACRLVVDTFLHASFSKIVSEMRDDKSSLQQMTQAEFGITPRFRVLQQWGKAHDRHFRMGVFLQETQVGAGEGASMKEAEKSAAKNAIETKEVWMVQISSKKVQQR